MRPRLFLSIGLAGAAVAAAMLASSVDDDWYMLTWMLAVALWAGCAVMARQAIRLGTRQH